MSPCPTLSGARRKSGSPQKGASEPRLVSQFHATMHETSSTPTLVPGWTKQLRLALLILPDCPRGLRDGTYWGWIRRWRSSETKADGYLGFCVGQSIYFFLPLYRNLEPLTNPEQYGGLIKSYNRLIHAQRRSKFTSLSGQVAVLAPFPWWAISTILGLAMNDGSVELLWTGNLAAAVTVCLWTELALIPTLNRLVVSMMWYHPFDQPVSYHLAVQALWFQLVDLCLLDHSSVRSV